MGELGGLPEECSPEEGGQPARLAVGVNRYHSDADCRGCRSIIQDLKSMGFPEEKQSSVIIAKTNLTNLAKTVKISDETDSTTENMQNEMTGTPSIWDDFDVKVMDTIKNQNPVSGAIIDVIIEVDKYLDEPLINRKSNNCLLW
ncbi:unnamed protein product [Diatraea saccharalis]|uniref:Uncharacterized protein n=1 Tax=Diatraea saccharalis TaxID=40085 RepID=A0A9N9WK74_9NEOP|nr:unnamed protein product [Diatraea saccharalis]